MAVETVEQALDLVAQIFIRAGQRLDQTGKATDGRPAGRPARRDAA